jgi:hypothetical protein
MQASKTSQKSHPLGAPFITSRASFIPRSVYPARPMFRWALPRTHETERLSLSSGSLLKEAYHSGKVALASEAGRLS